MGSQGRYYIYSGYSITGPMLPYFDKNGGLKKIWLSSRADTNINRPTYHTKFDHGNIQCDLTTAQCKTS